MNFRNKRLGSHLSADYTIIMSRTLKVTGSHIICIFFTRLEINYLFHLLLWPFFFRSVHGKIIIRFGFCDILNNQGRGRGYRLKPSASAENPDNPYREKYAHVSSTGFNFHAFVEIPRYHKNSSWLIIVYDQQIGNIIIPPTLTAYDKGVPGLTSLLATFIQKATENALNSWRISTIANPRPSFLSNSMSKSVEISWKKCFLWEKYANVS